MAVHPDQLVKIALKYVQYFVFLIQVDQFCGSALKIWLSTNLFAWLISSVGVH